MPEAPIPEKKAKTIPAPTGLCRKDVGFTISSGPNRPAYPAYFHFTEDLLFYQEKILRLHEQIIRVRAQMNPFSISRLELSAVEKEFDYTMDMAGFLLLEDADIYAVEGTPEGEKRFKETGRFYHQLLSHKPTMIDTPAALLTFWKAIYPEPVMEERAFRSTELPIIMPHVKPDRTFSMAFRGRMREETYGTYMWNCPVYPDMEGLVSQLFEFMDSESRIPPLVRIAIFHFFFGYFHPLPCHNGLVLRYLTTSQLAAYFHDLSFLPFSTLLHTYYQEYYGAFQETERNSNEGSLNRFIYIFLFLLTKALEESLHHTIWVKRAVEYLAPLFYTMLAGQDENTHQLAFYLLVHSLICRRGITRKDLLSNLEMSKGTMDARLASFPPPFLLQSEKNHPSRFGINLDEIARIISER